MRTLLVAAILALLFWRVGVQPFVDGLQKVTIPALGAAMALGAVATLCCAWRWRAVSRGLGMNLSLSAAAMACYRSTFLNSTLPTGIAGDVHRAVHHGRAASDVSRSVRSVTWERAAGQVVQISVTIAALLVMPSPVHGWMPLAVAGVLVMGLVVTLAIRARSRSTRVGRLAQLVHDDVRGGVLRRDVLPVVLLASVVVVSCHVATFLIAAQAAGAPASFFELVPIALLVLAAMALPLSVAGWGPREGTAAWAFGAAGLGAAVGLTTAVVYGALALAASLPGAAVLIAARRSGSANALAQPEVAHG